MRRTSFAFFALALAALAFGATFVIVKEAIESLPPLAFVGWRFLIGAGALILLAWPRGGAIWRDGLIAGALLFAGYAFQTWGLQYTSASNSGLITGLYVVATPLLATALTRRRPATWTMVGALAAFAGLALLTIEDGFRPQGGDVMTLVCALAFAGHIVALSRLAFRHPVIPFTAVQLLVTAALSLAASLAVEGLPIPQSSDMPALVSTGLIVTAGAFLLQVWAQTVVGPARTAVVLALEPVFAMVFAAWLLTERLTGRGRVGAGLIVAAIYLVVSTAGRDDAVPAAEAVSPAH